MTINWLKENEIIANPCKFKFITIKRSKKFDALCSLNINNQIINKSTDSVRSLGVEMNNKLIFDGHISRVCKKAGCTMNAIKYAKITRRKEARNLYKHFYYFKLNLLPFCMAFFFQEKLLKLEKIQERFLKIIFKNYTENYEKLLQKLNDNTHL